MRLSTLLIAPAAAALFALSASAIGKTRAECERDYTPQVGQAGKDVIWVPTPDSLVARMLTMAKVTPKDFVVDLGAGDGKIAIAAGKDFGLRRHRRRHRVQPRDGEAGTVLRAGRRRRRQGEDHPGRHLQGGLQQGHRGHDVPAAGAEPVRAPSPAGDGAGHAGDIALVHHGRNAYLWIVPARVGGTWNFRGGNVDFAVTLNQSFQKIGGEATMGGRKQPLVGASLSGDAIRFSFNDAKGATQHFSGTVQGNSIIGSLRTSGVADTTVTGTVQGALAPAPWAEMASGCERFYGK